MTRKSIKGARIEWWLLSIAVMLTAPAVCASSLQETATNNSGSPQDYTQARVHYMLQCQGCHLASGKGTTSGVPDMTEFGALLLRNEKGRQFFIQVPGASNAALNNLELANVLNYIIDEVINARDVAFFSESEIEGSRGKPINDIVNYRQQLIDALQE